MDTPPTSTALRVLVVDDNPAADSTTTLLDLAGFEARSAYSGPDALRVVTASPPNVVLLDLRMPEMNGFEFARRLRDHATPKRPLLVAVTGCSTPEEHRKAAEAGIDLHLDKPVDPALRVGLLKRFQRVLAPSADRV
jgi:CheY-like chemotaxis protein